MRKSSRMLYVYYVIVVSMRFAEKALVDHKGNSSRVSLTRDYKPNKTIRKTCVNYTKGFILLQKNTNIFIDIITTYTHTPKRTNTHTHTLTVDVRVYVSRNCASKFRMPPLF